MSTHLEGIELVFEDDHLIVVNKPSGMLSQPGKTESDSVVTRVMQACPNATGPMLVHRLDMDTSGLLILAKNRTAHRTLQQQFEQRLIGKRYRAILDGRPNATGGRVQLPLRLDIDDRPRQIVCNEYGKQATTLWHCDDATPRSEATTVVVLYPLTGRTHQLRVHMADPHGVGIPILGDRLYGGRESDTSGVRLMLHAELLAFDHPVHGTRQLVQSAAPFLII
jgi:tRNA pseudouridine32 synthase / 23S rRNA pseudouridine746 synthase